MIDVVCVLGNGSHWNDNELRYSLRSLVKFGSNFRSVIIIGDKPEWIQNIIHIPFENPTNYNHEHNIYEKILVACKSHSVSENFLMWNDDYFLTAPIDCSNYPYYYNCPLSESVKARLRFDGYAISLDNSRRKLEEWKCKTFNYDIHCPIIYNKKVFVETVGAVDWSVGNGYVIKSLYANSTQAQELMATWNQLCVPRQMNDLKINVCKNSILLNHQLKGRHIFSLSDKGLTDVMKKFLKDTYTQKSIYEL